MHVDLNFGLWQSSQKSFLLPSFGRIITPHFDWEMLDVPDNVIFLEESKFI